jgi:DNA-binding transcriptional regulator YhcF (GntR family)
MLLNKSFDNNKPIFLQIREVIEDQIVKDQLKEGEQAPSTNQLVNFYKINHATVTKGVNQLVEEGILYKKRVIGMFVAEGAKNQLIEKRRESFKDEYVLPLVQEAAKLGITLNEIVEILINSKGAK